MGILWGMVFRISAVPCVPSKRVSRSGRDAKRPSRSNGQGASGNAESGGLRLQTLVWCHREVAHVPRQGYEHSLGHRLDFPIMLASLGPLGRRRK